MDHYRRRRTALFTSACLAGTLAATIGFASVAAAQGDTKTHPSMSGGTKTDRTMMKEAGMNSSTMGRPDAAMIEAMIASWKVQPRELARKLMSKYGAPHEATATRLIWFNNGPWKMTELVNEEIAHEFPKSHKDMLKQTIDYRVPPGETDELAEYDGSVIVDRTKGEISARCDQEAANFLALNLAHDIVSKKMSPKKARVFYAEAMLEMKHAEYKQGFLFPVAKTGQGDADGPLRDDMAKVK